ncbi:MAG: hypothetical protein Q8M76_11010 [Spirochaetaceae bacterium]|nr:hypothetical protein [Spirochaetaceae bacterium]
MWGPKSELDKIAAGADLSVLCLASFRHVSPNPKKSLAYRGIDVVDDIKASDAALVARHKILCALLGC